MEKLSAIVPAAGIGLRLKSKTAKPYISLNGKPLLWYCLNALDRSRKVSGIVLVSEKAHLKRAAALIKKYKFRKIKAVIAGGVSRTESVYNGLSALDKDTDYVLIHDGARPFLDNKLIEDCFAGARKYKAAICAIPCLSTIKQADKKRRVVATLDRDVLWQVQTPQVFDYKLLCKAYDNFKDKKAGAFDDASLVERLGLKVRIVEGNNRNIKITTQEDLKLARAMLKAGIRG